MVVKLSLERRGEVGGLNPCCLSGCSSSTRLVIGGSFVVELMQITSQNQPKNAALVQRLMTHTEEKVCLLYTSDAADE